MMNLFLGFLFGILGGLITIAATIPWVITGDKATAFTLLVVVAAVGGFACAHFTNSVRARLGIVRRLIDEHAPDILCLQETKVENAGFPAAEFAALGYRHQLLNGQRMHHGVAILSRLPLVEETRSDWQANGEARHIGEIGRAHV